MEATQLLTIERQARIGALLSSHGRVLASHLAEMFKVSEDTVRRDLREMAEAGLCRRVYGGAVPAAPSEGSLVQRRAKAQGRKSLLAKSVAATIPRGSVLFIDAGSTNIGVAEALDEDAALTVVTNAPAIACAILDRRGIQTILLGGRVDAGTGACLGPKAMADAGRFRPDILVLGACGVHAVHGVTAHVFEEAELKASLAARSGKVLVAATNEKLGTAAPYSVLAAAGISALFVEHDCEARHVTAFENQGIAVTRGGKGGDD